jgi:hypothetical protein
MSLVFQAAADFAADESWHRWAASASQRLLPNISA